MGKAENVQDIESEIIHTLQFQLQYLHKQGGREIEVLLTQQNQLQKKLTGHTFGMQVLQSHTGQRNMRQSKVCEKTVHLQSKNMLE